MWPAGYKSSTADIRMPSGTMSTQSRGHYSCCGFCLCITFIAAVEHILIGLLHKCITYAGHSSLLKHMPGKALYLAAQLPHLCFWQNNYTYSIQWLHSVYIIETDTQSAICFLLSHQVRVQGLSSLPSIRAWLQSCRSSRRCNRLQGAMFVDGISI